MKVYRFMDNYGNCFSEEFATIEDAKNFAYKNEFIFIGVAHRLGWNTDVHGNRLYEEYVVE